VSDTLLRFEGVSYTYPGSGMPALDRVDLEIGPGELCLLAGLSGHGKSTLLRAACGLVPHFHGGRFAGRVTLAGHDTRAHGPAQLGGLAGVLFQDPETQLVLSTVRAELALALESRGHGAAAVARGVEEVALALGIDRLLDRSTHDLSGGEKQRVALAAALSGRPRIVLLDEPTSQLDPVAGDELIGLLRRLNQEWETTILLAEHRLERCLSAADRVIAMRDGAIACDGTPQQFVDWASGHDPALQTPAARLFALAGLAPAPTGVRQARTALRARGLLPAAVPDAGAATGPALPGGASETASDTPQSVAVERTSRVRIGRRHARAARVPPVLELRGVWHELRDGPAILRGATMSLAPGECVALMGRNGAGKSTLLRHAAGLLEPTRGGVSRAGRVALLLQNPGDYFIHERAGDEAPAAALDDVGLAQLAERNPRDLSGGERQRLALAIVTATPAGARPSGGDSRPPSGDATGPAPPNRVVPQTRLAPPGPVVLALDEPTRGMDRAAKAALAADLRRRARRGQAVIVATHDPEFAAACAERAVLLADGRVIADDSAAALLAGGWYFATETARILGGARGALLPEQGAALIGGAAGLAPPTPAATAVGAPVPAAPVLATESGGAGRAAPPAGVGEEAR
jgi:energy-coupling factor transport system ATP-binding protein